MKITNVYNLPEVFLNAVGNLRRPVAGRFSVTDISNPPYMRYLKEKYWDDIEQDVSDMLWLVFGKAVHSFLEGSAPLESLSEEKIIAEYKGVSIVGVPDLWHNEVISDYKITSVWSFLLGEKAEWVTQLNLYKWLYENSIGLNANKLEVHAILRDWQKTRALYEADYPKIPYMTLNISVVDNIEYELDHWLARYDNKSPCTLEERWARPDTWAVKKKGNKRASKVFEDKDKAYKYCEGLKGNYIVEERKGGNPRCEEYCLVRNFCDVKDVTIKH